MSPCFHPSSASCHLIQCSLITCRYCHPFVLGMTGIRNVLDKVTNCTVSLCFFSLSLLFRDFFRRRYIETSARIALHQVLECDSELYLLIMWSFCACVHMGFLWILWFLLTSQDQCSMQNTFLPPQSFVAHPYTDTFTPSCNFSAPVSTFLGNLRTWKNSQGHRKCTMTESNLSSGSALEV